MSQAKSSKYVPLKRVKYKDKEYEIFNVVQSLFVYLKEPLDNRGFRILKVAESEVTPL